MKRKIAAFLTGLLLLAPAQTGKAQQLATEADPTIIPEPVYAVDENGDLSPAAVNAETAICLDADTGAVLYEKQADKKMYPASITKVMTCMLALEYVEQSGHGMDEVVTVEHTYQLEKDAVEIYMKKGEQFTMEQLLYALMLKSANDAALLLAEHISGSVESFVESMNEKAAELGMTGTHFVNPNGLHDDDHYTTARDMAVLMRQAIQNENFCKILQTMSYQIPETAQTPEIRYLSNSNRLMKESESAYYEPCMGGKTGYTSKARNTFVCYARKDGRTVVAAVMHSPLSGTRFASGKNLLRYGLENFESVDLAQLLAQNPLSAQITGSEEAPDGTLEVPVNQVPQDEAKVTLRKTETNEAPSADDYEAKIQWRENLRAPIVSGEVLGTVSYYRRGEAEAEAALVCDLVASRDVTAALNAPGGSETGDSSLPVVTDPAANIPARQNASVTTWMTVALIVLIALIVIVAFMLLRAGGGQRSRHSAPTRRSAPRRRSPTYGNRGRYNTRSRGRRR